MKFKLKISILTLLTLAMMMGYGSPTPPSVQASSLPAQTNKLEKADSNQQLFNIYIPMFYNEESGYTSSILLNNVAPSPASIVVTGYTEAGQAFTFSDIIPTNGSSTYALHPNIPTGFKGAIVISSDRQLIAMSTISDTNFAAFATYVGRAAGSLHLFLPALRYHRSMSSSDAYTTIYSLQNTGSSPATVTISYSDGTTDSATIPPNSPAFFQLDQKDYQDLEHLSATVTSDQPLVAAVLWAISSNGELYAYTGFESGTTQPLFPLIEVDSRDTQTWAWLQNVGDQATDVTLEYIPSDRGALCEETYTLSPGDVSEFQIRQPPCSQDRFEGHAQVKTNSTDQPLVGLALRRNFESDGSIYGALDVNAATNAIFLPLIQDRGAAGGGGTRLTLQHIGGPASSMTCHFSDTAYQIVHDLAADSQLIDGQQNKIRDGYTGSAFCLAENSETRITAVVHQNIGQSGGRWTAYEGIVVDESQLPFTYDCTGDNISSPTCLPIEPLRIPTAVTINGPTSGTVNTTYTFQAQVTPADVTQPFTHDWQADGQAPINQEGGGIDAVAYTWDEPGTYNITVSTSNVGGSVSAVHEMTITDSQPVDACSDITEIPLIECQALKALYDSTDGTNWVNKWFETNTPCSWPHVTCSDGRVQDLVLGNERLNGEIPPELGNLTNLRIINAWDNQLVGEIPPELGNLINLQILSLMNTQLSGEIPSELGKLVNLQYLSLYISQLSGEIPSELGNLVNLKILSLSFNQLSGPIPISLTSLSNLENFSYYDQNGLCEPDDSAFQVWLAGIERTDGDGIGLCSNNSTSKVFLPLIWLPIEPAQ